MWTDFKKCILFSAFVAACAPQAALSAQIFWLSDPVKPGQSVQVNGMDLGKIGKVEVARLKDSPHAKAVDSQQDAEIIAQTETSLTFVLPASLGEGGFIASLTDKDNHSVSALVNTPDVYWAQADEGTDASPGGWIRVQGRNIARTPEAVLRLRAPDGRETDLPTGAADLWSARFSVPDQFPEGRYEARLWNGNGDVTTWRDVGTINVRKRAVVSSPVMELLAIPTDGPKHDDTSRINASLAALGRRGGGTLVLRQGIYDLSGPLSIPNGVSLKGISKERVTLSWKDTDAPPPALISGLEGFAVTDLTINAYRHFDVIKGGFDPVTNKPVGRNITIRNVTVRANAFMGHITQEEAAVRVAAMKAKERDGVAGLRLAGPNIVIEGCDILSSMRSFVLVDAVAARVNHNIFRNGRTGWYGISGSDQVIFEDNRVIGGDLGATGGGINTLGGGVAARNVLFERNSFETILGWDREAMTSDGPYGYYFGAAVAVASNRIRMTEIPQGKMQDRDWSGAAIFVLAGRSMGAVAHVVSRDGDVLTLDTEFSSMLDSDSIVTVVPAQEKYLIIDNKFTDVGSLQVFGTGYKHVYAENSLVRSAGIYLTSLNYYHPQPNFFLQVIDNDIKETDVRGTSGIFVTGRQFKDNPTILSLGIVIRGNQLGANTTIRIDGKSTEAPAVRAVLVEDNIIDGADIGIDVRQGVRELTLRNNPTTNTRVAVKQPYP
jgi:hypothetical protein